MKLVKTYIFLLLCILTFNIVEAQQDKKTTYAKAFEGKIKIDGVLDEIAWKNAPVTTDFTENEPEPNTKPSQKTEVKIIYNKEGIYFGAVMHDTQPEGILKQLSARDNRNNTDWFSVALDTYQDGLNAFEFIVTAAGVQQDLKYAGGFEDINWDAVWQSEVLIHEQGWNVEIFIPYSAIRFPTVDIQHWNIQFTRELRREREQSYWNPLDPNFEGFVNQFGHLEGIKNIESPFRLSITPYITGYLLNSREDGESETGTSYNAGMDLKYGINDAFTLDMTLVPDFGQVQQDNRVLNLSPFEVFYDENRQFFTEGLELFNRGGLFYTRRVGGRPINFFEAYNDLGNNEIVTDNPSKAQLYNASKISGRTSKGTGIGFFNAIAGETHATIKNIVSGQERIVETNPLTNYNVLVVDQNLPNNGRVSVLNTNVMREGSTYDANTTGIFLDLNSESQAYAFQGNLAQSKQFFEEGTNKGHTYFARLAKVSGTIKAQINYNVESDTYDPNDLGFLYSPNERSLGAGIAYNQPNANGKLARYEYYFNTNYNRLYAPNEFVNFSLTAGTFYLFKSRDAVGGSITVEPTESYDYFEPRDNFESYLSIPSNYSMSSFYSSDYRKTFAADIRLYYRKFDEENRHVYNIAFLPRLRVNDKLSFFMDLSYNLISNDQGFVNKSGLSLDDVSENDILIGRRNWDIYENILTGQYIFNNKQAISLKVRHYHAKVVYNRFGVLDQNGKQKPINFDGKNQDGNPLFDQNFNAFIVDMNYSWRFAPGSDIILNFQSQIEGFDNEYARHYFQNLGGLFDKYQENSLSLRLVYFLDYLYLK